MVKKAGVTADERPSPRRRYKLIQESRRTIDGEAGLFESVDNLFNGHLLVIVCYLRDVGILVHLYFFRLYNVAEGPTDPVTGVGSLAVWQG